MPSEGPSSFVSAYLGDVVEIAKGISVSDIESTIRILFEAWRHEKQIFVAGNGGSASTATHFASDLNKYTTVKGKRRFRGLALTDNVPLITALVNDEGWENVYLWQLENLMQAGDVLVAISVHGGSGKDNAGPWSQNLLKAVKFVQDREGKVIGLAGFDGGVLKRVADACIVVPKASTPHVEGFHLVLTHMICARLRELISES